MNVKRSSILSRAVASATVGLMLLAGCSSSTSGSGNGASSSPSASSEASAAESGEHPSRIVAVSSETADMALLLAGPEAMVAIAAASQSPSMGMVPDLANQVAETLPAGITPDAEQILAYEPDLVLTTSRHGGEKSTNEQLASAGVEMVTFESDDFNSPEAYADALRTTGDVLGYPEEAEQYATELLASIEEIDAQKSDKSPRVLVLMVRGGKVMAMASNNMLPGLALRAGATDATTEAGITSTAPIDGELLVRANPDLILLEDFQGGGEGPFQELLNSPAVADVPAIANQNIHVIEMTEASSLAGINLPVGYQKVMDIVSE
ncbi:ABC transporter substrate-binding protein [Actinomycetaceae bacterium L2_0104]